MNKVIMKGNLTKDADIKELKGDKQVSNFTLAVDKPRARNNDVVFVNCVAWNKMAKVASKYLKKGRQVLIEGWYNIRINKTEDRTYINPEVVIDKIYFIDQKQEVQQWPEGIPKDMEKYKHNDELVEPERGFNPEEFDPDDFM